MSASSSFQLVLGTLDTLEDAFVERVRTLREREPLAPVDVLVGGVLMRPYLQRLIAEATPGLVNIRFSTLGELGIRLGEPTLAASGRRPLPAIAERVYTAEVSRGCTGYFAPVASTPGFAEAVRRLLRELRQEGVDGVGEFLVGDVAVAEDEPGGYQWRADVDRPGGVVPDTQAGGVPVGDRPNGSACAEGEGEVDSAGGRSSEKNPCRRC